MESLFRFNALFDSLNNNEQQLMIADIINSYGVKLIKTALFHHLFRNIQSQQHRVKEINEAMSNMIHNRQSTTTTETSNVETEEDIDLAT